MGAEEGKVSHKTDLVANHINICLPSRDWNRDNAQPWWQIRLGMNGGTWANKLLLPPRWPTKYCIFLTLFLLFLEHFYMIIASPPPPLNCCSLRGVNLKGASFILKERLFSFPAWTQVTELLCVPLIRNTIKYLYSGRSICSDEFPAGQCHSRLITCVVFLTRSIFPGINWLKTDSRGNKHFLFFLICKHRK